jgi:hypothetical protein
MIFAGNIIQAETTVPEETDAVTSPDFNTNPDINPLELTLDHLSYSQVEMMRSPPSPGGPIPIPYPNILK